MLSGFAVDLLDLTPRSSGALGLEKRWDWNAAWVGMWDGGCYCRQLDVRAI